jgi:hypothetical protein
VKTLEAAEMRTSKIINLYGQKVIIIRAFSQKKEKNFVIECLGLFLYIAARFCCTHQNLVAKGLLLGVRVAAPTHFLVKRLKAQSIRSMDLYVICNIKGWEGRLPPRASPINRAQGKGQGIPPHPPNPTA